MLLLLLLCMLLAAPPIVKGATPSPCFNSISISSPFTIVDNVPTYLIPMGCSPSKDNIVQTTQSYTISVTSGTSGVGCGEIISQDGMHHSLMVHGSSFIVIVIVAFVFFIIVIVIVIVIIIVIAIVIIIVIIIYVIIVASYGYYECAIAPPGIGGTVTTCAVISTISTKYESIYIKFFGNDTSRVYFGYFTGGVGYLYY